MYSLQLDPRKSTPMEALNMDDGLSMPNQSGGSELQRCLTPKQLEDRLRKDPKNKMLRDDSITLLRQMSGIVKEYSNSAVFNALDERSQKELNPNETWPKLLQGLKDAAKDLVDYRSQINSQHATNDDAAPSDRIELANDILVATKMLEMDYNTITNNLKENLFKPDQAAREKNTLLTYVNLKIDEIDAERRRDKSGKTIS